MKFWLTLVLVGVGVTCWVAPGIAAPASLGGRVTADEPQYLLTALSLGEDFNLDISVTKSKRYTFEIGAGGARITVEAFSGDITISSSGRSGGDR